MPFKASPLRIFEAVIPSWKTHKGGSELANEPTVNSRELTAKRESTLQELEDPFASYVQEEPQTKLVMRHPVLYYRQFHRSNNNFSFIFTSFHSSHLSFAIISLHPEMACGFKWTLCPRETSLSRAHVIAETLQCRLEGLNEVDRAFVSVD